MTAARLPRLAFAEPAAIRRRQERLLARHLEQCLRAPFYRRRLKGLKPPARGGFPLDALAGLPLTDKTDLERENDAFLAVPRARVRDIVQSSGTTGLPTRILYTAADLDRLAYNESLCFQGCGVGPGDTVLLTCTLDRCFIAGLAYCLGAQAAGAATVRNGLNSLESHAAMIAAMRPTFVVGVPGFLRKLGRHLREARTACPPVKGLMCIGEPLRDARLRPTALTRELEALWRAPAFSTYASSEIITSFCECAARRGGHAAPDLAILEIVAPDGRPLPPGETGEIVVTPLGIEGMPLLRFRTGDLGYRVEQPCACGRNTPRLSPILGRLRQMLKIRGATLYPAAVYAVLDGLPEVSDYSLVAEADGPLSDRLTVHVTGPRGEAGRQRVEKALQARLRVRPEVRLETEARMRAMVFPTHSRKPVRFHDRRPAPTPKTSIF